ncbi:MAG TPA: radical SAM protein [bacterium]|nr:radical SAM protein [Candidatus Omnitrophota bacterium]HOJ62499.1 radical SAM protein [bacterium]HOL94455.1 radical SAM protein [bacterium]HPP02174.1 radical SAM protein [bacterium]HXK93250.1 radical SAM protein [bacterium]
METTHPKPVSTVYGPVRSWRVGLSLGIDLILETSVCSFNCIYCQLGNIQVVTNQRKLFVPTDTVLRDFLASRWRESDIITYSGSGEPTLATNLGEVAREISRITPIPQLVLTNGALLQDPQVIQDLQGVHRVYVKLDAASEEMFQRINRPANGITLASIVDQVKRFRKRYKGMLGIQVMFMPLNRNETERLAEILRDIQPDEVQLNTPTRPYPRYWHIASRGGHTEALRPYPSTPLRTISREEAAAIETRLRDLTGLPIVAVNNNAPGK